MNEEIKRKADEIFAIHYKIISIEEFTNVPSPIINQLKSVALKHAILSTKNTIGVLNGLSSKLILNPQLQYAFDEVAFLAYEQREILKELESRI